MNSVSVREHRFLEPISVEIAIVGCIIREYTFDSFLSWHVDLTQCGGRPSRRGIFLSLSQ